MVMICKDTHLLYLPFILFLGMSTYHLDTSTLFVALDILD
jgi:hypothetical protein